MKPHLLIVATLALGLARVIAILAALALGVGACGQSQEPDAAPQAFRSVVGSEEQIQNAAITLDVFRNLVDVDATRVDLVFVATWEEQRDACHGLAACTSPQTNGYLIATFWPSDGTTAHAYMLAHELCHVYYLETGAGGDPNHGHEECFGRPGAFGGGEGYAWQAALDVAGNI